MTMTVALTLIWGVSPMIANKVYIIVGWQKYGTDWNILYTVYTNREEAVEVCSQLNAPPSGWEYKVEEMELKQ